MADMNEFDDIDDYSPTDYSSDDDTDSSETSFTVLKEADICRCIEHEITGLSDVLSISKLEASLLLRHYNWNVCKVHDAWFVDEFGVRKKVGLLLEKPEEKQVSYDDLTCGICFESYSQISLNLSLVVILFVLNAGDFTFTQTSMMVLDVWF